MRVFRLAAVAFLLAGGGLSLDGPSAQAEDRTAAAETMLRTEGLGDLRLQLPEKGVLQLLGKPEKQTALILQEADGEWVQDWLYPSKGLRLTMSAGGKKTGAKTIARMTASAPCALATKKGIKIGSEESAVRKAYAAFRDRETPAEPGVFVAGSIYGGIIFNFEKGKVSRIFFGAAAE